MRAGQRNCRDDVPPNMSATTLMEGSVFVAITIDFDCVRALDGLPGDQSAGLELTTEL